VNTVTVSFDAITRQLTEISQSVKRKT